MKLQHNYFLSATLAPKESYGHRPLITVLPALAGAAITPLANPLTFIASGAAVAFWFFFATEKELGLRGYERNEIVITWWVPPSIRNIKLFYNNLYVNILCLLS